MVVKSQKKTGDGGVVIIVKYENVKHQKEMENLEDINQDIIWIEIKISKSEIMFLWYNCGFWEDNPRKEVVSEFTHTTKLNHINRGFKCNAKYQQIKHSTGNM